MTSTVQKWGNSLALRIPNAIAKDIDLHQGSAVDLKLVEGRIVVRPMKRRALSLAQLLREVTAKNIHREFDWGRPMGKEVW